MTATFTDGSWRIFKNASIKPLRTSVPSAFMRSGLLIVTIATAPFCSNKTNSDIRLPQQASHSIIAEVTPRDSKFKEMHAGLMHLRVLDKTVDCFDSEIFVAE